MSVCRPVAVQARCAELEAELAVTKEKLATSEGRVRDLEEEVEATKSRELEKLREVQALLEATKAREIQRMEEMDDAMDRGDLRHAAKRWCGSGESGGPQLPSPQLDHWCSFLSSPQTITTIPGTRSGPDEAEAEAEDKGSMLRKRRSDSAMPPLSELEIQFEACWQGINDEIERSAPGAEGRGLARRGRGFGVEEVLPHAFPSKT